MKPRSHSRWRQPHYVLLLLLCAAAVRYGCCSYVGEAAEGAHVAPSEAMTTKEKPQQEKADESVALGNTLETRRPLRRTRRTTVSPRGSFSRRTTINWAGAGLLGITLLYVIMAEKRIAGAEAAREKEKQQTLLAVDQKDEVIRSTQREDAYCKVAREELEALDRQEKVAQEKLEAIARRRAEAAAQASGTPESREFKPASYDEAIEAAEERVRKAKKDRDAIKEALDMMDVLKELTEDSASAFIERLRLEQEAIEAEDAMCGVSLEDLKAVDSPEKAVGVAKDQLAALKVILEANQQEVSVLEADAAAAREKVETVEKDLEEQLGALQAEKQQLMEIQSQGSAQEEENKQLAELNKRVFGPTSRKHLAVKAQLEALTDNFENKEQGLQQIQEKLLEKLAEVNQEAAKWAEKGPPEPTPPDVIHQLSPEMKELLEAREELEKLEYQSFIMAPAVVFATDEAEKVKNAEAEERLRETYEQRGAAEGKTKELEKAEEAFLFARGELNFKKRQIDNDWRTWADLIKRKNEAQMRVERCERQVAQQRETIQARLAMLDAFAAARVDRFISNTDNLERTLQRIKKDAGGFAPKSFEQGSPDMDANAVQRKRYLLELEDDYFRTYEKMIEEVTSMRAAAIDARPAAYVERSIEIMQEMPLEVLVTAAAAGRNDDLQKTWVAKRRAEIDDEVEELKQKEQEALSTLDQLRTAMNELAHAYYFSELFPAQKIRALAYMMRLQGEEKANRARRQALEAITQEEIESDVERAFVDAAFRAKERRERFGTKPQILLAVHMAVLKAIHVQSERLEALVATAEEQEGGIAPAISVDELPKFALPDQTKKRSISLGDNILGGEEYTELPQAEDEEELGDLTGLTIKNVLQLRKSSKKKKEDES